MHVEPASPGNNLEYQAAPSYRSLRSPVSLKVMTFNLRRRKESDGLNIWDERRDAAAEVIRRQAPDLVGTQEGLREQVGFLQQHFPEYGILGEARMGGDKDEYNAILYRKDRFRVSATGNFWLSDTPELAGSRTWGNLVPRMATWALFEDKDSRTPFFHLNTHLDHLVPAARKRGAELIQKRLPRDLPVIMTGDLNAVQQGGTYRFLTGAKGAGLTDSRWACQTPVDSRWNPTFHRFTGRGFYRIDYVLGRRCSGYANYQVVRDRVAGKLPSDHFPVVVDVGIAA